jgi:hypothetical protein
VWVEFYMGCKLLFNYHAIIILCIQEIRNS